MKNGLSIFHAIDTGCLVDFIFSMPLSGGVNSVMDFINEHPGVNSREIAKALDLPQRTLERYIKDLKIQKRIEFRGAPKTGGYFLLG